jgi:AbrB family looped-hinge helix DNA binding protein
MNASESHVQINENGRIVIPAHLRRSLGIRPGETLILRLDKNELRITTLRQRLAKAREIVRRHVKPSVSLADELIAERREAAKHE